MIVRTIATIAGATGVHLMVTTPKGSPARTTLMRDAMRRHRPDAGRWLRQAGLIDVSPRDFLASSAALGAAAGLAAHLLFDGWAIAFVSASIASTVPAGVYRQQRGRRMATAHRAWPALIEEIRTLTGAAGRSIPAALFEAGATSPAPLQPGFAAGWREWRVSTDFERTVGVLQREFDDPTADAACEMLLTAYEIGGTGVDRRLSDLADDRRRDLNLRDEAIARQAGVRFARRFVLVVPVAMAAAGLSLGNGRAAYASPQAQFMVIIAIAMITGCWWWSGRLLRLPVEQRLARP